MPASSGASPAHIKDVNARYHDAAAASYDTKWGIDFGAVGQHQVKAKLLKALGEAPSAPFGDALEIGAGTGYFTLNLLQLGLIERATATDISPGMLRALGESADRLGIAPKAVRTEAEQLPFEAESFDLVFGHAILHHLPDPGRAFSEFHRVLRPGGTLAFCGEPSRYGDLLAALPKRSALALAPLWRLVVGAGARPNGSGPGRENAKASPFSLEGEVDVHAFSPGQLRRLLGHAGFERQRIRGEEFLANLYGWGLRTVESTARAEEVPRAWRLFAFRSYLALKRIDGALEPRLPPQLFYNLVLSARKPQPAASRR